MYVEIKFYILMFFWEFSFFFDEVIVLFFYINIWFKIFINKIYVWFQEVIKIDN